MDWQTYFKGREHRLFAETKGFDKSDVQSAAEAMMAWVQATEALIESMDKIPETFGSLGGSAHADRLTSENPQERALALEVQKARLVVQESDLVDLSSRMNQFAARLKAASDHLF